MVRVLVLLWLAVCARTAVAQTDLLEPYDGMSVRTTWPETTDYVLCSTATLEASTVAVVSSPEAAAAGIPLEFPRLEVRCQACNAVGCSGPSPNALVLYERELGDCDGNGALNVADLVCVNVRLFQQGP